MQSAQGGVSCARCLYVSFLLWYLARFPKATTEAPCTGQGHYVIADLLKAEDCPRTVAEAVSLVRHPQPYATLPPWGLPRGLCTSTNLTLDRS